MITFRTFAGVWTWERRIYKLERIRLPMPVTFRWIGAAIGSFFLVVLPLNRFLLDHVLPWAPVRYAVLPILMANWLTKAKLDGKPPLAWVTSVVRYLFMRKRWARYKPLRLGRLEQFKVQVLRRSEVAHPSQETTFRG